MSQQQEKGKKPPVNDQEECELKEFIKAAASHWEHEMNLEQLHAKISETNSKLFEEFDRFLALAREGSQASDTKGAEWKKRGNDAFKAKNYDQAILCYTRALHDIKDAKAQAILLTNRATCLFHAGLLAHALGDAQRAVALDASYKKVYYRRGHIFVKLGKEELGKADIAYSEATGDGEATVDAAAVAAAVAELREDIIAAEAHAVQRKAAVDEKIVKIEEVPGLGKRWVAAKSIPAGTVVVSEDPYTAALRPEFLLTHCEWCLQHTPNLYPSSRLQQSNSPYRGRGFYCNERCEALAWENYGEVEAQHPFFLICPLDATTALRGVMRLHNASKAATKTPEDDAIMAALEGHSLETERTLDLGGKESACTVLAYHAGVLGCVALRSKHADRKGVDEGDGSISVNDLWKYGDEMRLMMRRVLSNAVGVSKLLKLSHNAAPGLHAVEQKKIASAIYPHIALANHACDPSAYINFVGGPHTAFRRARLRVTRNLSPGDEVSVSYGPHKNKIHSVRNRREALQKQWNFLCNCDACVTEKEDPIDEDKQQLMVEASTYYQKGRSMMRQRRHGDAIPALDASLKILLDKVFIGQHRTSFVVGKTHDSMAECFAAVGDFAKALIHCEKSVACTKYVHGDNEIEVAHEYLKMSGLAAQCQDFDRAREALKEAEKIFSHYYGDAKMPEVEECRDAIAVLSKGK